jgi:long-subunit acyl-CoA synthetase (AMP-forming)
MVISKRVPLAGIPVCPIPPPHPDRSRQLLFLEHLQILFNRPTIIAEGETIQAVLDLVPNFKTISMSQLQSVVINDVASLEVFPKRYPKPDDIVCLMLTSGSTGNSKAVGLRHSNLLSCVDGKIKHHATTSSSRFLNWIAFDHVACVSEVHLQALRADARYVGVFTNHLSSIHVSAASIMFLPRLWFSTPAICLNGQASCGSHIRSARISYSHKFAVMWLLIRTIRMRLIYLLLKF